MIFKHRVFRPAWIILFWAAASACSTMPDHYKEILPGMHSEEVFHDMEEKPARRVDTPGTFYTTWYWGDHSDYCVLFDNDLVVSKDEARGRSQAQCAAPVHLAKSGTAPKAESAGTVAPVARSEPMAKSDASD